MEDQPKPRKDEPVFNAPAIVIAMAALLVLTHAIRVTMPSADESQQLLYQFSLLPPRFDGLVGGVHEAWTYDTPGLLQAFGGHVLLHADWMHVTLNAIMLLAVGAPVARLLGQGVRGVFGFLTIFILSATGGALLYLILNIPDGPPAVGASGGVSGLMACALMIDRRTGQVRLLTQQFMATSVAFFVANLAMIYLGPQLTGGGIAWEAHIGGWICGALLFRLALRRQVSPG